MFGRHRGFDGDAVAAAQRRLAALAAQHRRDDSSAALHTTGLTTADQGDEALPKGSKGPTPVARHLGRRTELGRWGVSAQHVTVAALLVVAMVVAVAWWALRSAPQSEPVRVKSERLLPSDPMPGPPSDATAPSSSAVGSAIAAGSTGQPARLVIDVAGKVRDPGIVELPAGSRVVDAIAAAGGARPGVSLTSLNLARLLVDGEQIVVGVDVPVMGGAGASTGGVAGGAATGIPVWVNLNTATAEQLDTLPGVGPVTAQAILQWRADNGPFARVDDLLDVSGIGPATMADIRPYVYV